MLNSYILILTTAFRVREKLGKLIQMGDATEGHSSVEDASSTLDLVRWYILNRQKSAVLADVTT